MNRNQQLQEITVLDAVNDIYKGITVLKDFVDVEDGDLELNKFVLGQLNYLHVRLGNTISRYEDRTAFLTAEEQKKT